MNTLSVTKYFKFEAAHHLPGYDGACASVHGHSYVLEIEIGSPLTEEETEFTCHKPKGFDQWGDSAIDSMVIDLSDLKNKIKTCIVDFMDHEDLNTLTTRGFPYWMPTAENIIIWIWKEITEKEWPAFTAPTRVRLWETADSYAEVK